MLASAILLAGVASVGAQTRRGRASFYSKRATGARAANGERIHHDSLTCAHRTYPFGTLLKVTNMRNGKSVIVRVTDRGPHRGGRIIDLSYGAARELGMLSQGIAMVEIERVDNTKVPYRDDVETGLPEFEFDFSKLTLPEVPNVFNMHNVHNVHNMPNTHNRHNKPNMPNMPNKPNMHNKPKEPTSSKAPATQAKTPSPIINH